MADEVDPYEDLKKRDAFIGVWNIEFTGPRRMRAENVRIVFWRWSQTGELFYLIGDDGSIYNFSNINMLTRVGD